MKIEIDVEEFARQIKEGKGLSGKDGALTPLIKQLTEMTLQAELAPQGHFLRAIPSSPRPHKKP